jgi:hypothetical protein
MTSKRKFYRHVYHIEVLSEEELPPQMNLADIAYAITGGSCSGEVSGGDPETMDGLTAAKALQAQRSDPAFFGLTPEGDDVEED